VTSEAPEDPPVHPFAPEDGAYAAIVSEYVGLQRAGADPLGAALITAAHLILVSLAGAQAQQRDAGDV
jgi:hypothetical protein